jgi:hypothetical protein
MLDLPLGAPGPDGKRMHISALLNDGFASRSIRVAGHCFGCTAGQGSSCGGALDAADTEAGRRSRAMDRSVMSR